MFPPACHSAVLGEYQERQDAQNSLLRTAMVAGLAILLLLQAVLPQSGGWRGWLFLTLPMALVGGVLATYIAGGVISLGPWSASSPSSASPPATASC